MRQVIYEIKISGIGTSDESSESDSNKQKKKAEPSGLEVISKALHPIKNLESASKNAGDGAIYYAAKTFETTLNLVTSAVQTDVNRYFQFSEDYKNQAYLGNVKNNISKAKGLATSAFSGAVGGAVFGPVGMAVGATLGAVTSGINMIKQYDTLKANYESSLNATRVSTAWQAQRAGLYNNGRGTEN